MRFETIGYSGRFKDVVGDPAIGFHMMVYGKPFQGKSSFVIELCKDLIQLQKGRVAYLALEEGISASMQKKIIDRQAGNIDGLDFMGAMPGSFDGYTFVVIDSVSDRAIKRDKLRELFLQNPKICFICIFHATKEGSARGGLDYSHDMDIIIKIEGHQPFVEKNRFL
jgi:predicted ATP-dependent serine protease